MSHAIRPSLRLFSLRRRFSLRSLLVLTALIALGLTAGRFANLHLTRVYTGRALDVAIDGPGYFRVTECYENEPVYYARKGRLWIDENCLVRIGSPEQNLVLDPPISLPPDAQAILIEPDGSVRCRDQSPIPLDVGMLQLAMLSDPDSLRPVSPGIYSTDSVPITAAPGEQGAGLLATGWLEMADPYRQDSALFVWPALLAAFAAGAGLTAVVNIACKPQRPENRPGCRILRTG